MTLAPQSPQDFPIRHAANELYRLLVDGALPSNVPSDFFGQAAPFIEQAWLACESALLDRVDTAESVRAYVASIQNDAAARDLLTELDAVKCQYIAIDIPGAGAGPNDTDNGIRFARQHAHHVKYVYKWNTFFIWDGKRWCEDTGAEVIKRADATARSIAVEASTAPADQFKELLSWAKQSLNKSRLENMIDMAKPYLGTSHDEFDSNPWLLNCENGTIDLRTGELLPHDPRNLITKIVPVDYNPQARSPEWEQFIGRIFANNASLISFVQRYTGYSLTGDVGEQCMVFLYGTGANGKSTFCETLILLLGEYAQKMRAETLSAKRDDSGANASPDIARLVGARLVIASEVEEGRRLAESLVKDLTGNDTISTRQLYQKAFDFKPSHKLIMYGNHKPIIRGTDGGIWRRIRLVPFGVTIPEAERDSRLGARLAAELSGILAWAVRGCIEWQQGGLQPPEAVTAATNEYRAEMDVLGLFVSECCIQGLGYKVEAARLYDAYEQWCDENGEHAMSAKMFGLRLKERGCEPARGAGGKRLWKGIALADFEHEPPTDDQIVTHLPQVTHLDAFSEEVSTKKTHGGFIAKTSHHESRVTNKPIDAMEAIELTTEAINYADVASSLVDRVKAIPRAPLNVNERLQRETAELAAIELADSDLN